METCGYGDGKGRERLNMLINEQLTRLKRVKAGLFMIGHTKVREIKQKMEGEPYSVITSNLAADNFNIFGYKADVVCNIITEKVINDGVLADSERYMYFRSDGFVDAGSRFGEIPNRVEYGASNYIEAVETGIKNSLSKPMSDKELIKRKKIDLEEKNILAKQSAKAEEVAEENDGLNDEMVTFIQQKFPGADAGSKTKIKALMAEYNIENFKNASELNTDGLKAIVAVLNE